MVAKPPKRPLLLVAVIFLLLIGAIAGLFVALLTLDSAFRGKVLYLEFRFSLRNKSDLIGNHNFTEAYEINEHEIAPQLMDTTTPLTVAGIDDNSNSFVQKPETFIDIPTVKFPRMILGGVFPLKSSDTFEIKNVGRQEKDSRDVGILIESTNWNDTIRWVESVSQQRKWPHELFIFLYSPTKVTGVNYNLLKSWTKQIPTVRALKQTDIESAMNYVLVSKSFVVSVKDYEYAAEDFADFYFTGKSIMELDNKIESVCGGSNGIWQDSQLGDIIWLSDTPCKHGEMRSRRTASANFIPITNISLRPEVARVGVSERSVARDNDWNIDRINPEIMMNFDERLEYDLAKAETKPKDEWVLLETFDCTDSIYKFPYQTDEDLEMYFEHTNINDLHKYQKMIPLSINGCRVYIVPKFY